MSLPRDPVTKKFLPRTAPAPAATPAPGAAAPAATPKEEAPKTPAPSPDLTMAAAKKRWWETIICAAFFLLLSGCMSTVCIEDRHREIMFKASVPVFPWQDSLRVIDKMNVSARGSNFSASLRGLSDSETISTNAADFFERGISAATRGAVSAALGLGK